MDRQVPEPLKKYQLSGDGRRYALSDESLKRWRKYWLGGLSGGCLSFIFSFPLICAYMIMTMAAKGQVQAFINVTLASSPIWFYIGACFASLYKQHMRRGLEFQASDAGLRIKAGNGATDLYWNDISSVFLNNQKEYVIQSKSGDYYFPDDMRDAAELFEVIKSRIPSKDQSKFELNATLAEGGKELLAMPYGALLAAIFIGPLAQFLNGGKFLVGEIGLGFALAVFVVIVGGIYTFASLRNGVVLLRCSQDGILLRSVDGDEKFIEWSKIQDVKYFQLMWFIKTADKTWFVNWAMMLSVETSRRRWSKATAYETQLQADSKGFRQRIKTIVDQKVLKKNNLIS